MRLGSACKEYIEDNGVDSIDLGKVLEGRKNREAFHWFLDNIASVVVGATAVEQVKSVRSPTEWLSRSLEAFSLLCMENYFDMIKTQVGNKSCVSKPLWTADGRGKRKNQGWSQEGIRRYNVLCKAVKRDREAFPVEDEIYLNTKREEKQAVEMEKLKRRQERTELREQGLEAADDDFSMSESNDFD